MADSKSNALPLEAAQETDTTYSPIRNDPRWQFDGSEVLSHLEVDTRNDSAFGSETSSITTSLASSVIEFRYEHGRRYHAFSDRPYHLPNDEREMDRLELQHILWSSVINGRLYLCPLQETVREVLDIGCGTGAWAIAFADAHPNTQVLGTDISPIQPYTVPVNCQFVVDDATADWNFGHKFDFIHTRAITFGISDWDRLVEQAFDSLNPGGWIELQEFCLPLCCDDGSMSEDYGLGKWGLEMHRATAKVGINSLSALEHSTRMRKRGFINIDEKLLKVPLGPWAKGKREKMIGLICQKDVYDAVEGMSTKLLFLLRHSQESVTELIDGAKAEIMDPDVSAC